MTIAEELAELDRGWDQISSYLPESVGTFGHPSERRLGLRVPASCWALLKGGERSAYARTVELSPTGAVLELLDEAETALARAQKFDLDIFVPGATRPVHAVAWPARAIGKLQAFEFLTMSSADRLTLAEHLDHVVAARPSPPLPAERASAKPPVSWKNFVLSLKRPAARAAVPAQRS
jgi:hypothetical protein